MNAKEPAWLWGALSVGVVLAVWQAWAGAAGGVTPTQALNAIVRERAFLIAQTIPTLTAALVGLAVAVTLAFISASAAALSSRANHALTPWVLAQQTVPLVAIAPLVAGVIGDGFFSIVIVTAWLCWFPAVTAFTAGLMRVDPDQLAVFRVARATSWQTYSRLRLPSAAAAMTSGLRASAGFALIGAIVAEYGSPAPGLGASIMRHVRGIAPLAPDALMGLVIWCAVLGAVMTWSVYWFARRALRPLL